MCHLPSLPRAGGPSAPNDQTNRMRPSRSALAGLAAVLAIASLGPLSAVQQRRAREAQRRWMPLPATAKEVAARPPVALPVVSPLPPTTASAADQRMMMVESARGAWKVASARISRAGFVGAADNYPFVTVWDMASALAAMYSARELGFITTAEYTALMSRALGTLATMPRYDGAAFNKLYASTSGQMIDRRTRPSTKGYGWSATDHGRLLIWLRIVGARDTLLLRRTEAIAGRLDMTRLVDDGYLRGQDIGPTSGKQRVYQEGRIGYEQYAAEGFSLWGVRAPLALDFTANGKPVAVEGQTVLADTRGGDLLTSEPFVLMGLELGWTSPQWRDLSLAVLAAQEARSRQVGHVVMLSEDALPDPPAYFYYYLLYREGKSFVVASPWGSVHPAFPRWVSAKAAFGYHALVPSDYTWRALESLSSGGRTSAGWTAGVYEGTHDGTRMFNMNTTAVVLESAAYYARGCPLIVQTCPARAPAPVADSGAARTTAARTRAARR